MIFFILLVYCICSINVCNVHAHKCMIKISNLVRKVMLLRSNCAVKLKFLDFSADNNGEYTVATLEAGSFSPFARHLWWRLDH